jgi:hypothetical protein
MAAARAAHWGSRFFFLKPQHAGRRRVLELQPRPARPRPIGVRSVLRDDALEPQLAGVLEDRLTVPDDVLVKLNARVGDLPQEDAVAPAHRPDWLGHSTPGRPKGSRSYPS